MRCFVSLSRLTVENLLNDIFSMSATNLAIQVAFVGFKPCA